MAEIKSGLFHLKLIRIKNLSERETDILNIFALAMEPTTPETAALAASQLDLWCPPLEHQQEAEDYLWKVWDVMLNVARSPDVTNEIQERLVSILECLRLCAKGDLFVWTAEKRVWADLPLFPQCVNAYYDDPMLGKEELTPESVWIWRNLNSFAARCLGAGVMGPYIEAMEALRAALEELSADDEVDKTECRILVACDWISHGAKLLLWWARENIGYLDVTEEDRQYVEGGPLYHGPPSMCLQRWGFWQERFEELGREESGLREEIRNAVLKAAGTMRTTERRIGNTL